MAWLGIMAAKWWLHTAVGGGIILFLAWIGMRCLRQPARRQRLGEWGVIAASLFAVGSLCPAWLVISVPVLSLDTPNQPQENCDEQDPSAPMIDHAPAVDPIRDIPPGNLLLSPRTDIGPPRSLNEKPPLDNSQLGSRSEARSIPATPGEQQLPASSTMTDQALPTSQKKGFLWSQVLAYVGLVYLLVAGAFLLRWLAGIGGLWRILRSTEPAPPWLIKQLADIYRGKRLPQLLLSRRLRVPMSCGVFRPKIVLPAALSVQTDVQLLRWILSHEAAHLEGRDPWACWVLGLGQVIYFYLPWFWRLQRHVRLCQEYVADAAAVQAGEAIDYAQFLLCWTTAPALPASATGVRGDASDLSRRITMLLQARERMERQPPWRWSFAIASGLLTVAMLTSGIGFRSDAAVAAPASFQEKPKKDQPRYDDVPTDDCRKKDDKQAPDQPDARKKDQAPADLDRIDQMIEKMLSEMGGQSREELERIRKRLRHIMEMQRDQRDRQPFIAPEWRRLPGQGRFAPPWHHGQGRLGVRVESPSEALISQLDLPKDQGLLIVEIIPDSPAAKAELKVYDVLLSLNGQSVARHHAGLLKLVSSIKGDTPIDVVVMRKGRKETIKGLKLPEAKDREGDRRPEAPPRRRVKPADAGDRDRGVGDELRRFRRKDELRPSRDGVKPRSVRPMDEVRPSRGRGVLTSLFRDNERFTGRHEEGSLIITVTGKVTDGKAKAKNVRVQDGGTTHVYESLDKVPEAYLDKVKYLIEMAERGTVKIEMKTP